MPVSLAPIDSLVRQEIGMYAKIEGRRLIARTVDLRNLKKAIATQQNYDPRKMRLRILNIETFLKRGIGSSVC